jgi:hypothetical protein
MAPPPAYVGMGHNARGGGAGVAQEPKSREESGNTMKNTMAEEDDRRILARINALIAEACTHYQERGIPVEEVGEEALLRYAFDRLTEAERVAFGMTPRAELEKMFAFAALSNRMEDIAKKQGRPPPLLSVEDPERAQLIVEAKRNLRERDEEEAYWRGDEAADDEDGD